MVITGVKTQCSPAIGFGFQEPFQIQICKMEEGAGIQLDLCLLRRIFQFLNLSIPCQLAEEALIGFTFDQIGVGASVGYL